MPETYRNGLPTDRETAVAVARFVAYGPGEHPGKPVPEAVVQAAYGGVEAARRARGAGRQKSA